MAYAFQYNPDSAPVANRITRFIPDCQPMDWSAKPNTLINPAVTATDYSNAKWNGSAVVNLSAQDLAAIAAASVAANASAFESVRLPRQHRAAVKDSIQRLKAATTDAQKIALLTDLVLKLSTELEQLKG